VVQPYQNQGGEPEAQIKRMNPLLEAAQRLQDLLDSWKWRFCLIGGIALLRWGDARFTRDVDVSLLTGFGREDEYISRLLNADYRGRMEDAAGFARRHRVLLVTAPNGVPVDIALAALPFEARAIERATLFEFAPGCLLRTCSAEDLMVLKLFAFRAQDLADVESLAARRGKSLDWAYVLENLSPLAEAKDEPSIMNTFARLRRQYGGN
jgi:hypothetical protein